MQSLRTIGIYLSALILVSCASQPGQKETQGMRSNDAIGKMLQDEAQPKEKKTSAPKNLSNAKDIENLSIDDVIRIEEPNTANLYDDSRYDFPITMNSKVEGWIDYFTGRGRGHMERYLGRSSRYLPVMKQIFKKAGLPEDLVYLALIESGFNLRAKSRARAVGPWQFMKATGKRYGLRVDAWVDERRDPIRSTEAAAAYLKDLYLMFESWYLAASGYNAGEYKVLRAIEQTKTNNFWRICETKMLRRETKDYIPKLIAAAIIGKNAKKYGFQDVAYQEPLEFEVVEVNKPVKLREIARIASAAEDDILDLNPQFIKSSVPPSGGDYSVRVPVGTRLLVQRTLSSTSSSIETADIPKVHTVRSGETLAKVASQYRLKVRDLANANNLSPKETVQAGTQLLLPIGFKVKTKELQKPIRTTSSLAPSNDPDFVIHIVKRGESLWSISEQYNVTVQNIFKWNNIRQSAIHPGKKLKIKAAKNVDGKNETVDRNARNG